MDAYQDFVAAKPIVDPPDHDELEAIWASVVDQLSSPSNTDDSSSSLRLAARPAALTPAGFRGAPSHDSISRRRALVLVAVAASIVLLVVLIGAVGRYTDDATQVGNTPPARPTSTWRTFAAPPIEPRFQHVAVATDTGIFVWGGCCANAVTGEQPYDDGAYYEAASDQWRVLPPHPFAEDGGLGVAVWTGAEVVALTADAPAGAAAFDPETFEWRPLASPTGTGGSGVATLSMVAGRVALADRASVELFDLTTETWSPPIDLGDLGPLPDPDRVLLADGTVSGTSLAVASRDLDDCAPATVHVLDAVTETVTDVPLPENGWWPSDLVGIGNDRFLAFGAAQCGENQLPPAPRAVVVDAATGTVAEVSAPPYAADFGGPSPTLWTGGDVVSLTLDGRLAQYQPAADRWTLGDPLLEVLGDVVSERFDSTALVWFDDQIVVVSPALVDDVVGGALLCCTPVAGAWASPLPAA